MEIFATVGHYLERGTHLGPVCLVLDARMSGLDGFELQKALAGHSEWTIFRTGHRDVPMCAKAM